MVKQIETGEKKRLRSMGELSSAGAALVGALSALGLSSVPVSAQDAPAEVASPSAKAKRVNDRIVPAFVRPKPASGRKGPLAEFADRAAEEGFTFNAITLNFALANPSAGLQPGNFQNSAYNIVGVDYDLSKRFGLVGSSLHYQTTFFTFNRNYQFLGQVGDTMLGYQGTFNIRPAIISVATFEQKLLDDRVDIEIGRTNAFRYYSLPGLQNCQMLDTCFQDILQYNAGVISPLYSQYGGNVAFKLTPTMFAQAGIFGDNGNPRVGYEIDRERYQGVLVIGEVGRKTTFANDPYPSRVSLLGFVNTSPHADLNQFSALTPTPAIGSMFQSGTSGALFQVQKIVWRADGGLDKDAKAPTALSLYGSAGTGFDSTQPILAHIFGGATLQSPFEGRPADRFGAKIAYERINDNFANYLAAANLVSGGSGAPFNPNKFVFELNAQIQLPLGMAFQPAVQYGVNLNSFYNPFTAARPRNGFFLTGAFIIPFDTMLGLAPS